MDERKSDTQGDETIGKLIAAAGPGVTASPEARERIYGAVHARWRETVRSRPEAAVRRRFRQFRVVGLAAGVAAAAVVLYWMQDSLPGDPQQEVALARLTRVSGDARIVRGDTSTSLAADAALGAGDVLRTGADGRLALELADGLSLRLNVDTELVFADAANVELTAGTIYVDSGESGADTALEVITPFGSVEHLGTQYEVRYDDASLRVRVREGAIAFTGAGAGQTGTAGEQLDFDAGGLTARSAIAPDDEAWAWATGLASLPASDAHSVVETLAWIARESGLTLEFEPAGSAQRLARESLVGLSGLNPEETLSVIERTTDLSLEIGNGVLLVRN